MSQRVRTAIAEATARLTAASVASPRTDAELLAAHVLGVPRGRLVLVDDFTDSQAARFEALVDRRTTREPLQHLIGSVHFAGVELAVGPGVFIPRPETELLVSWAVARGGSVVLDLCSGSGAIALALAHALPAATVTAVESSPSALAWLRRNAAACASAGDSPIQIIEGDATLASTTAGLTGWVDLLVCNPPYVPSGTVVPPEVSDFDPAVAVFGGPDGLDVIRSVVVLGVDLVRAGGWIGLEHDDSHGEAVAGLLAEAGWSDPVTHLDLAGRPRFTVAQQPDR